MTTPDRTTTESNAGLIGSARDFQRFGETMLVLAELAPERMTLSQTIFFVLAGTAELSGKQPTFTDIKEAVGEQLNRSLHSTYRVLMEPSRAFPKGLGWLTTELNPNDNREKFIRLTAKGRSVLRAVQMTMKDK